MSVISPNNVKTSNLAYTTPDVLTTNITYTNTTY